MTRIPSHTIDDPSEPSRPLLEGVIEFSPAGKPLNPHAQMAPSAYLGLTVFPAYFPNCVGTESELPTGPQAA
jgi:hypothetical protein